MGGSAATRALLQHLLDKPVDKAFDKPSALVEPRRDRHDRDLAHHLGRRAPSRGVFTLGRGFPLPVLCLAGRTPPPPGPSRRLCIPAGLSGGPLRAVLQAAEELQRHESRCLGAEAGDGGWRDWCGRLVGQVGQGGRDRPSFTYVHIAHTGLSVVIVKHALQNSV